MPEFSEESLRSIAREKVHKRLAVEIHLAAYLTVNLFLAMINLLTLPTYLWFLWPVCSWAILIVIHATSYGIWLAGVTGSKIGAVYHAMIYISVNLYLIFIWWFTNFGTVGVPFMWFLFPLFGWGVGLALHFVAIRPNQGNNKSWIDSKVDKEIEKLRAKGALPENGA